MPENTVSVCRPSRFGNPFPVTRDCTQKEAAAKFEFWLTTDGVRFGMERRKREILESLPMLRGKNLACYCRPGTACHADTLLRLANEQPRSRT